MYKYIHSIDDLCFDFSSIEQIYRDDDDVFVLLDNFVLAKSHESSEGKNWDVEEANLIFLDVVKEVCIFCGESNKMIPHSEPSKPVEIIYYLNKKKNHYEIGGFSEAGIWSEWLIYSDQCMVQYNKKKPHEI